ncbi:hypothetical protein FRC01_008352 [Tulasnella sp. 417]|nr:hypothetical protein FRC01_008352 [Tulasnella sp. 417]
MPRRFASQVHVTVSRLLRSRFIDQPPAWFDAVMQEVELGFEQEREAIKSFMPTVQAAARHSNKLPWAAVWSMPGAPPPPEQWTRGEEYMQKVEQGVRPSYSPDLAGGSSFEAPPAIEQAADPVAVDSLDAVQPVAEPVVQTQKA